MVDVGGTFVYQVPKTSVTAHTCPPCVSTMTRRVYTSRFSFLQWHGLTQRDSALVVSLMILMKNQYRIKFFVGEKEDPFDLEVF